MIGQIHNIEYIDNLKTVPHFIVIVGSKGSGKTTLTKYISNKINAMMTEIGIKVDSIREIVDNAYTVKEKILYHIKDADTMRAEAKNAMLKVTEEPPENAYFVLTVSDDSTLLDTIKSRAIIINIEPYTEKELRQYYAMNYTPADSDCDTICSIATTPYEVDKLIEYGGDFLNYVELVVDNISEVESANAFKSSSKLAIKTDTGYDLELFWKVFVHVCMQRLQEDILRYTQGVCETIPFQLKVNRLGVNKQQLYDSWVFKIREVWL